MSSRRFFIVGCQRSGTTLVKLILEGHSEVHCYDEHLGYQLLAGRLPSPACEKPVIGFKVPRLTEQLTASLFVDHDLPAFPNCYRREPIVFLVRDVRDTVASMMSLVHAGRCWLDQWGIPTFALKIRTDPEIRRWAVPEVEQYETEQEQRLALAAAYWRYKTEALTTYLDRGLPVCRVRYEDLVTEPQRQLSRICEFLGVPWEACLLEHHRLPHTEVWRNGLVIGHTDPRRSIDRRSVGGWSQVLSPPESAAVLKVAGPMHQMLYGPEPCHSEEQTYADHRSGSSM